MRLRTVILVLLLLSEEGPGLLDLGIARVEMEQDLQRLAGMLVIALVKLIGKQALEAGQLGIATDLRGRGAGRGDEGAGHAFAAGTRFRAPKSEIRTRLARFLFGLRISCFGFLASYLDASLLTPQRLRINGLRVLWQNFSRGWGRVDSGRRALAALPSSSRSRNALVQLAQPLTDKGDKTVSLRGRSFGQG